MKVILNQDVHNLGEEGDVVVVKRGYARNFLLPKEIAVPFNKANEALFAARAAEIEKRKEEKRKSAASVKEKLEGMVLTVVMSAGDTGKLFGSVTNTIIQEALAKEGIDVERKRIEVDGHSMRMVGSYSFNVRLYEGESATVKLEVVSEAALKKQAAEKEAAEKKEAAAKKEEKVVKEEVVEVIEEIVEEVVTEE
jgi:large subunit ribosomal protein L9